MSAAALPLTYRQNPRPVGFEIALRLAGDVLHVDSGRKELAIPLASVVELRLTYEPRSMAQAAYQTKLRLKDGKTVKFSSISWRSMIDARRQDREYSAFARALVAAVARANPSARFVAGKKRLQWAAIAAAAAFSLVAVAAFVWQALRAGAPAAALLGIGVAALGIWQLEPMVRLNRPRPFSPGEAPAMLLP